MLACALPRLAALAFWHDPPATHYSEIAANLADRHRYVLDGASATYMEPLCPAVFAAGRLVLGSSPQAMLVLPLLASTLAGLALFSLTRRKVGDRGAWVATALYACSPYLVRQSASLMEVTLATSLLVLASWRIDKVRSLGEASAAGMLLGAAVLTRFSFVPIAAGGLWVIHRRGGPACSSLAAALALACVLPWMVYSNAAGGAALPARIGENLFVSTNEWGTAVAPRVNVDVLASIADDVARERLARQGITEYGRAERDRALLGYVRDFVLAHPFRTVMLKLRNLAYAVQPRLLPFTERAGTATIADGRLVIPPQQSRSQAYEWIAGVFQAILLAGGAAGIWRRRAAPAGDAFLLVVLASVIAVNAIFFPTSRLLAPMTFVLAFYAAAALAGRG